MKVDTTSGVRFGNLTKGGGLPALFDGEDSTVAYSETQVGYFGTSLPGAKRIDRVELSSATNGFDASGHTTNINIKLYARNGSPPAHAVDGVLLGSVNVVDENQIRVVCVESSDKKNLYEYVWVRIATGVWTIASEIEIFEADEPPPPTAIPLSSYVLSSSCNVNVPLSYGGGEIPQFRVRMLVEQERTVLLDFHGDVVHTGGSYSSSHPFGFSFRLCKRSADSEQELEMAPFQWIDNAVGGGNVLSLSHHYGNKTICSYTKVSPGWHEFSVIGSGHSYLSSESAIQILAEGGKGLNCLRVTVLP